MQKKWMNVLMALSLPFSVSAMAKTAVNQAEVVPGEIIVKLKEGVSKSFFAQKSIMGATVNKELDVAFGNLAVLRLDSNKSLDSVLDALNNDPRIEYAEPNFIYRAGKVEKTLHPLFMSPKSGLTNDPMVGNLWGILNTGDNEPQSSGRNSAPTGIAGADIDAQRAWGITKGDRKVVVAVIDTGIDYNHPDLKNNMWVNQAELNGLVGVDDDGNGVIDDVYGAKFHSGVGTGDPMDGQGHGTHCAGTIGAVHDNAIGVAGVMADVELMAVKFLTDSGSGSTVDAIMAVDYATKMNVDIMSNSWGGGGASQALLDAIRAANDKGIIFTAAAGNSSTNNDVSPHYPSNYDVENVISVAAHQYNDELASFSCYGKNTVHVAAPGRNILSTTPGNKYEVYSGTSMATPHVSGVVGLLIADQGRMDPTTLRNRLMATSVEGAAYRRTTVAAGRVNAYNFLTDTRPERSGPSESSWVSSFDYAVESAHPYANNANEVQTITVPGAKFVRVVIERFDFERNYDFLNVKNAQGVVIEKLTGVGANYTTDYAEGDTIVLNLTSDSSQNKWGYSVKEIHYVLE